MTENFFTTAQAAQKLNVSRVAVFKMIKSGRLQAARTRRSYHIPRHALEEFMGQSISPATAEWAMWVAEKINRDYGSALERIAKE